jgi:hypothetical protein
VIAKIKRIAGRPLAEGDPISTTLPFVRRVGIHNGAVRIMTCAGYILEFPLTEWRVTVGPDTPDFIPFGAVPMTSELDVSRLLDAFDEFDDE